MGIPRSELSEAKHIPCDCSYTLNVVIIATGVDPNYYQIIVGVGILSPVTIEGLAMIPVALVARVQT